MNIRDVKFNKKTWYMTVLGYIYIIAIFLSANSVYWRATNAKYKQIILILLLSVGLLLNVLASLKMKKIQSRILLMILVYYAFMIPFILYNLGIGSISANSITRLLVLPITSFLYILYDVTAADTSKIPHKIVNVGVFFAIGSLVLWVFKIMGIGYNSNIQIQWGGVRNVLGLYRVQFFPQGNVFFLGISVLRNSGIYAEAPMFSFVLSFSFITHLFLEKDSRLIDYKSIILGITMITTTSTTALLILIISIIFKFYAQASNIGRVISLLVIPIAIYVIEFILAAKMQDMGGSVNVRIDDIKAGFEAWKQHPILGNGLDNEYSIKAFMDQSRLLLNGNDGYSSGLMNMLASGGIIFTGLLMFIPLGIFSRINTNTLFFSICLIVMLLVSLVDTTYFLLFVVLYMYVSAYFSYKHIS